MSQLPSRDAVLIIDDDADLRSLVDTLGQICGVSVLEAADCCAGLKILETEHERIKLILLDYFMPGMEPAKCAGAICARAGDCIPIVLLTAAVDPSKRAAELNIGHWLAKPFELSSLKVLLMTLPGSLPETSPSF